MSKKKKNFYKLDIDEQVEYISDLDAESAIKKICIEDSLKNEILRNIKRRRRMPYEDLLAIYYILNEEKIPF